MTSATVSFKMNANAVFEGFRDPLCSGLMMNMPCKGYRKVYANKDFLTE
jgi:hypothetical protein